MERLYRAKSAASAFTCRAIDQLQRTVARGVGAHTCKI
jgi:hypothetical protein